MEHTEQNLINDYVDGSLPPEKSKEFEVHLKICLDCYETVTWINILIERAAALSKKIAPPHELWKDIYRELRDIRIKEKNIVEEEAEVQSFGDLKGGSVKTEPAEKKEKKETPPLQKIVIKKQEGLPVSKIGIAVVVLLAIIIAIYFILFSEPSWKISKIKGEPLIGNEKIPGEENFSSSDLLKTDVNSSAMIKIPKIGTIEAGPNTILKRTGEFQFDLMSGSVKADKKVAKEFLIIKVPSAEVKDFNLGGNFKLNVTAEGNSLLAVDNGWERINNINREAIVPSNYYCEIRSGVGPGIPYSFSASKEFIKVLNTLGLNGDETVLPEILSIATKGDAVSLWHLLQKVDEIDREKVYMVLAGFFPPPEGVTKEEILSLNREMLLLWLEEINLQI